MQLKKKRFSLLFIFNLFILFCIIKSANCSYNEYNCSLPNDCTATSNYPICLDGKCRQCVPTHSEKDCQCPPGDYCISDSLDPYYGYCRSKYSQQIIGRSCNEQLREKWETIIQGANDTAFCGLIIFNNNLTARVMEWEGECIRGICKECSILPIPSIPFTICSDGRGCGAEGRIVISTSGILSWNFLPYEPFMITFITVVSFMTVALFFFIFGAIYLVCWRKKKSKLN